MEEVRWWFEHTGRSGGILLLTGPAGIGKTATILAVAKKLGIEVEEWVNPVEQVNFGNVKGLLEEDSHFLPNDVVAYTSKTKQFKDWLRGAKYIPLSVDNLGTDRCTKMLLLEDMPNFKLEEFHVLLENYANSKAKVPVVFIISETASAKKTGSLKQIFPPELLEKLRIQTIQFNPVTTSNLVKILTKIALVESRNGVRKFSVPDIA